MMKDYLKISLLLLRIFNSPSEQIDLILSCVEQLKDIDKKTAIDTLQTFPMHSLYGKYHPNISSLYMAGQLEYGSIYYWFKKWENPLNNSLEDLQYVEQYEKRRRKTTLFCWLSLVTLRSCSLFQTKCWFIR